MDDILNTNNGIHVVTNVIEAIHLMKHEGNPRDTTRETVS